MEEFEKWLRSVCFQKPTPEAYDLAKSAWLEVQEQKWQPIETAPKDGTRILACSTKKKVRAVTWWRSRDNGDRYTGWGEFSTNQWPAEYWMPLTPLPIRT